MKCSFCSAPLPKKGLVCAYCGQRNALNFSTLDKVEVAKDKPTHKCPTCDIVCDNINIGAKERIMIQRCNECDGLFLGEEVLEELVQAKSLIKDKIDLHILRFVKDNPRVEPEKVIRYKKCPVCDITMQRLNYRAVSGVIVDKCHKHGIWLDGGELLQIYEWKKAGGDLYKLNKRKQEARKSRRGIENPHKKENDSYFDPIGDFFNWIQGA